MTDWEAVQRRRFAAGAVDTHGTGRKAHAMTCRHCNAACISGLDADLCALTAICDPWPVDAHGELAALLAGRDSYSLTWRGFRYELDRRTAIEIAATDPMSIEVLVAHLCGAPIPARRTPPRRRTRFSGRETFPIDPPF